MAKDVRDQTRLPDQEAVEKLSDDQVQRLAKKAQKLIERDVQVQTACVTILASYQLHNVALAALNRRMDELEEGQAVERTLIESMRNAAGKEFTRQDVLDKLQKHVLPWVAAEIEAERVREDKLHQKDMEEEDKSRRRLPVPLGFRPSLDWPEVEGSKEPSIGRARTLVVAGHPGAVKFLLDQAVRAAYVRTAKQKRVGRFRPNMLRLIPELRNHNVVLNKKDRKQFYEVGANRWAEMARSEKVVEKTLRPFVNFLRGPRIDLLVIDDFSLIVAEQKAGGNEPQSMAGRGHRYLRKWADNVGCAVLAGLPLEGEPLEVWDQVVHFDETWTQMEIYCDLVQVTVHPGPSEDTYNICAMRHLDSTTSAVVAESVDRKIIDDYRRQQPDGDSEQD